MSPQKDSNEATGGPISAWETLSESRPINANCLVLIDAHNTTPQAFAGEELRGFKKWSEPGLNRRHMDFQNSLGRFQNPCFLGQLLNSTP
jgi:hypothetical protein